MSRLNFLEIAALLVAYLGVVVTLVVALVSQI